MQVKVFWSDIINVLVHQNSNWGQALETGLSLYFWTYISVESP